MSDLPILTCSLERIAFRNALPEESHFGLNLATALLRSGTVGSPSRSVADLAHRLPLFLQPWLWPTDGGAEQPTAAVFLVSESDNGDGAVELEASPVRLLTDVDATPDSQPPAALVSELGRRLQELLSRTPARLHWPLVVVDGDGGTGPELWPAMLGNLSQLPYPLPQRLRLTFRFALRLSAEETRRIEQGAHLIAAPVLHTGLLSDDRAVAPVASGDNGVHGSLRLDYLGAPGTSEDGVLLAAAFCNPLSVSAPAGAKPLWVENPVPFDQDWRAHFARRLEDSLFLAPSFLALAKKKALSAARSREVAILLLKGYVGADNWTSVVQKIWGDHPPAFLDIGEPIPPDPLRELEEIAGLIRTEVQNVAPAQLVQMKQELLKLDGAREPRPAVRQAIQAYLTGLVGAAPGAVVTEWIQETAGQIASLVIPLPAGATRTPSHQTEGITLQVESFAADPTTPKDGEPSDTDATPSDPLQEYQGVVVLARRTDEPGWHCLNWTTALRADTPEPLHDPQTPLLLPARLSYAENLRQPTVTYDNAPLSVDGPLESLGNWQLRAEDEREKRNALVRFAFAQRPLPGLAFGRKYEFAAFVVSNSGALPPDLQSDGSPWKMRALEGWAGPPSSSGVVAYQRRVPVGAIRVKLDGGGQVRLGAPLGVIPRLVSATNPATAPTEPRPLLFLHEDLGNRKAVRQANFLLRPPSIDWRTWDRWIAAAGDVQSRELRQSVLSEFLHGLHLRGEEDDEPDELTLDDPAVRGFVVTLRDLDNDTSESARAPLGGMADAPGPLPAQVKRQPATIAVQIAEQGALQPGRTSRLDAAGSTVSVLVLPGGTYRLQVSCDLQGENLFAQGLVNASTWELDIEVAEQFVHHDEEHQAAQILWEAVTTSVEGEGRLRCELDLDALDETPAALEGRDKLTTRFRRQVLQGQVLRQTWAWRGRPLTPGHPDIPDDQAEPAPVEKLPAAAELQRYLDWEVSELGFRGDEDHAVYPMRWVGPGNPSSPRRASLFRYEDRLGAGPGRDGDRRAGHHRFAVRVTSRYAALMAGEYLGSLESSDTASGTLWRRRFVPCRWSGEVPTPKVRAVLPLTEDRSPDGRGSGFLVVLDEGWHEVGGLAEKLIVEVNEVNVPAVDGDLTETECLDLLQNTPAEQDPAAPGMGPDPIVFRHGYVENDQVKFRAEAAVGHSHEIDTPLPRILASSFIVRPSLVNSPKRDLSWWFFKVRFRRAIHVDGAWKPSEATQPYWVQLLPSFRLQRDGRRLVSAHFDGDAVRLCYEGEGAEAARALNTAAGDSGRLISYLLLTRQVSDALGMDQEIYLGLLYPWQGNFRPEDSLREVLSSERQGLQVRLIEVQQRNSSSYESGEALWDALFGDRSSRDEVWKLRDLEARIVRVSDPVAGLENLEVPAACLEAMP